MRNELQVSKINLMLMAFIAYLKIGLKGEPERQMDEQEITEMKAKIKRLHRAGTLAVRAVDKQMEEGSNKNVKGLFQKFRFQKKETQRKPEIRNRGGFTASPTEVEPPQSTPDELRQDQSTAANSDSAPQNQTTTGGTRVGALSSPPTDTPQADMSTDDSPEGLITTDCPPRSPGPEAKPAESENVDQVEGRQSVADTAATNTLREGDSTNAIAFTARDARPAESTPPAERLSQTALPRDGHRSVSSAVWDEPSAASNWKTSDSQRSSRNEAPEKRDTNETIEPIAGTFNNDAEDAGGVLQAWTIGIHDGLTLGDDGVFDVHEVSLPEARVLDILGDHETQQSSPLEWLSKLNTYQRCLVFDHVNRHDLTLLYVGTWRNEIIPTVLGELEVAILIWITSVTRERAMRASMYSQRRLGHEEETREDVRLPPVEGALDPQKAPWERRKTAIYKGGAQEDDTLGKSTGPIKFSDPTGKQFSFPWHLAKTWKVSLLP